MIKGTYFIWLSVFICIVFAIGMLMKGLSGFWIGVVLALLILGFYVNALEKEEELKNLEEFVDTSQDYKAQYQAPDEYNTPDKITQKDIDETIESMRDSMSK